MKNNLLKIFLPVLSAAALISCGAAANSGSNTTPAVDPNVSTSDTPSVVESATTHELYAFEAATGLPLISELASPPVSARALGRLADFDDSRSSQSDSRAALDEAVINEIKDYLPTVEGALLEGQELITATAETSDKAEYANKVVVSYTDINLAKSSFTMYFNETLLTDTDDDVDDDDDWDDRYEDDNEHETKITGIITFGDATYDIYGEKEIEDEETEVKFIYRLDETTRVEIQQEKELGETEFQYTVYNRGDKVYEYSLEVENNEVKLEVKDRDTLKDLELEFSIFERNGETFIKVEIENGRYDEVLFRKVVDEAGAVTYEVVALD